MNTFTKDCWFLTGATASGKTELGLSLARQIGAEIISLDSMAIYQGMDIGTAKPTPDQQAAVPHHMLDICDPTDEYSVAQYVETAEQVVDDIHARGAKALFVGGTPLYLKSLLRGFFDGPPADWDMRNEIQAELEHLGPDALHQRLEQIDPVAATQIHPNDTRRLIRAIEVFRATGEPLSHQQMEFEDGTPAEECRVFVLRRDRAEQCERIERRVELMLEEGLIAEVEQLIADGKQLGRTASQAVGYREVINHLQGEYDIAALTERMQARTRRFAKRQATWFRGLCECRFIDVASEIEHESLAEEIAVVGSNL